MYIRNDPYHLIPQLAAGLCKVIVHERESQAFAFPGDEIAALVIIIV